MSAVHVRRWTSEEFLASREPWQRLLARSDADPLFMSWDWLSCWWRHHAVVLGAELCVLAVYSAADELCGVAPFYSHRGVHRAVFRVRRLELLGSAWRDTEAIFSEYLDLVADRDSRDAVCTGVLEWLGASAAWDELVLCNVRERSVAARLATALGQFAYVRPAESMLGFSITLPESFDSFVAQLSSGTRRKLLHQRDKVADISCVEVPAGERRAALERLESFVARRWGGAPSATRAAFHAELVERWADQGALRLTELRTAGNLVSVMLNLRVAGTEYYLQSGFDEAYAQGLSPGYLHLGFAIEAACRDRVRHFDFLAGRGLHRDYKRDLAPEGASLQSLQVVRKPSLRTLFRLADRLRGSEN